MFHSIPNSQSTIRSMLSSRKTVRASKLLLGQRIRYRTTGNTLNKVMGHSITGWSNLLDSDFPSTVTLQISGNNNIAARVSSGPFQERFQVFKLHHPILISNWFLILGQSTPVPLPSVTFSAILIRQNDGISWDPNTLTYNTRFTIPSPNINNSITYTTTSQSGGGLSGIIEYVDADNPIIGMAVKTNGETGGSVGFEWHVEDLSDPTISPAQVIFRSSSGFNRTLTFDADPDIELSQRIRVQGINSHYNDVDPQVKPGGSIRTGYSRVTAISGFDVTYEKEDSESYSESTTASGGSVYIW